MHFSFTLLCLSASMLLGTYALPPQTMPNDDSLNITIIQTSIENLANIQLCNVKLYNETKYSGRSVFVQVESGNCIATNPTSAIDLSPPKIRSLRIDRPACICYFDFSSKKCEKGKTESFGIPGAKEVKSGLQSWRCVAPSPKGVESGLDSEGEIEDESSEEVEVAMNRRPYCGRWWPICEKRTAQ